MVQRLAKHRFLFALRPPPILARQMASAAWWFSGADGALLPERLHMTLFILDDRRVSGSPRREPA